MNYTKEQQLKKDIKKIRPRKCKECKKWYTPTEEKQECCSVDCAIAHVPKKRSKQKRKAIKKFRETDKSELMKVAQQTFNKYIRERDKHLPCISCGNMGRQRHAGHYRPVGRNSQHRFNEDNCHAQCSICNNYLSGNLNNYRVGLICKIGIKRVEALENQNTPKSYTVEELKDIIETYKRKIKELT